MKDRIEIESDEDGDVAIILRPRPRAKEDIETRAIRDAIDYLAELLVSQGAAGIAEILFKITEQEDTLDPIIHTTNTVADGGAYPPQYPYPRDFAMEQTMPRPTDNLQTVEVDRIQEVIRLGTAATPRPGRRR